MPGPLELIRGALQGNSVRWVLTADTELSDGSVVTVDVLFNVTKDFTQEWPGEVSEHPIEDATTIADHVRLDQERFSMTILLTPLVSGVKLATLLKTDVDERAEILIAWRDNATLLKLTGKKVVENLVIARMSERSGGLADSRLFEIELRKVKLADTDAVSQAGVGIREPQTEDTPL